MWRGIGGIAAFAGAPQQLTDDDASSNLNVFGHSRKV
jgi:hypothetical protein